MNVPDPLQQPVQHILDIRIGHQVVIIEHQQERLVDFLQVVGKELREDVQRGQLRSIEQFMDRAQTFASRRRTAATT